MGELTDVENRLQREASLAIFDSLEVCVPVCIEVNVGFARSLNDKK
jgi:hypothetical protein